MKFLLHIPNTKLVTLTTTHSNYVRDESADNQVQTSQEEAEEQRHLKRVESEFKSKTEWNSTAG